KIGEHASSGEHPLNLNLTYDYQDNVRVDASGLSSGGSTPSLTNFRTSYLYKKANQTVPLFISIKKQADFEITDTNGNLSVGAKKAPIEVTYRNIGDQAVKDAIARLSIFKPFSSIDDQAYIGSLDPNETKTVTFRLDVESDATPKEYGINSEIKYTDINGDSVISESMKIPLTVTGTSRSLLLPILMVLIILAAAGWYMYKRKQKKTDA
ncbi:MAG: LPXTG cell wall anchor domain-containing protein, partial [Methanotrichaceae archaeon]|nr:LPXTG cell wall anchor domain-containing protein [Methanotrichaceae archaeon]